MEEISTLENDIKGIKEAIDAKNAPMMVSYCCGFSGFFYLFSLHTSVTLSICEWLEVIYQTQETVFHWDFQTPRRESKIRHAEEYF